MKTNIFKDGQTIPVKLAENAAPQEAFAAAELCSYLERMTSTAVEQCGESYAGPAIAVGGAAEACGVAKPEGADSFTLKTVGESLCVTGGKRGRLREGAICHAAHPGRAGRDPVPRFYLPGA